MNSVACNLVPPKKGKSPFYRLRFRLRGERRWRQKSLGVREKQVAEKMKSEFINYHNSEIYNKT